MYLLIQNGSKKLWNSHNELYNATILQEWLKQNMTQFGYSNLNFVNKKHIHRYMCWHVHFKFRGKIEYIFQKSWGKANFSFYMSLPYMIFTMRHITFNFLNKHIDMKGKNGIILNDELHIMKSSLGVSQFKKIVSEFFQNKIIFSPSDNSL